MKHTELMVFGNCSVWSNCFCLILFLVFPWAFSLGITSAFQSHVKKTIIYSVHCGWFFSLWSEFGWAEIWSGYFRKSHSYPDASSPISVSYSHRGFKSVTETQFPSVRFGSKSYTSKNLGSLKQRKSCAAVTPCRPAALHACSSWKMKTWCLPLAATYE